MTLRQKLILFHISCDPGIRDIYRMVKIYDRADFPSKMSENLKPLLDEELICITGNFDNGKPSHYAITEKGQNYLFENFNDQEILEYVKQMQNPELLLLLTQAGIDQKNAL